MYIYIYWFYPGFELVKLQRMFPFSNSKVIKKMSGTRSVINRLDISNLIAYPYQKNLDLYGKGGWI